MLQHWLRPVNTKDFISLDTLSDFQWGKKMVLFDNEFPDLSKIKIALIGTEEATLNEIRPHLYHMSSHVEHLPVADLGTIQKVHPEVMIPLLSELIAGGIIPILIGKHHAYTYTQFMAYQKLEKLVNAVIIDERIPYTFDTNKTTKDYYYLNQILGEKDHSLFNLSMLGYQSHFTDKKVLDFFEEKGYELSRLGAIKSNLNEIEPNLRDADMISFDLSSIRYSDAPGTHFPSPSGIFAEEASQLCHFAGLSDKLTSIGIYGYLPKFDNRGQTAQLIAQMIWYFVDGYCKRKNDLPIESSRFTKYQVHVKSSSYDIIFWKSKQTDRWWLQIPVEVPENKQRYRIVPCSAHDYQLACKDEIPDRFINAFKRFDAFKT